jgi:hypothetical protein
VARQAKREVVLKRNRACLMRMRNNKRSLALALAIPNVHRTQHTTGLEPVVQILIKNTKLVCLAYFERWTLCLLLESSTISEMCILPRSPVLLRTLM